jgi:flagellar FliJ protein
MFKFRFETVLTTRRNAEEVYQKELAEARRALAVEQAALRDKRSTRRRCAQELQRTQRQGFRAPAIQLYGPYLARLERDIDTQQKRVAGAERKVNQKRSALIEAVKKRKVFEKLKEKDQKDHLNAMTLRDRKFMDDVASRHHAAAKQKI